MRTGGAGSTRGVGGAGVGASCGGGLAQDSVSSATANAVREIRLDSVLIGRLLAGSFVVGGGVEFAVAWAWRRSRRSPRRSTTAWGSIRSIQRSPTQSPSEWGCPPIQATRRFGLQRVPATRGRAMLTGPPSASDSASVRKGCVRAEAIRSRWRARPGRVSAAALRRHPRPRTRRRTLRGGHSGRRPGC